MEISKTNLRNKEESLLITFHEVTNKIDDSFVGLKMRNNRVDFYYPETYDFNKTSIKDARKDILAILETIAIAKTRSNSNVKIESTLSKNEALPLVSFLWIINDYLKHGFFVNREKILKRNQKGRVDWKRTLNQQPIISDGNVIYNNLVVEVKNELDNLLVEIHKYCVKKSLDILGWLFRFNNTSFIKTIKVTDGLRKVYMNALRKELNNTFDDLKRIRLTHMLTIVEGLSDEENSNEIVYGVDSYEYIYEKMINSIFGNRDATKFNPSAYWLLKSEGFEPFKSSDLRPDTILIKDNVAYVLDAKFYRYGYTANREHLPETTSIQKQITYGDYIKNNKMGEEIQKIRNAFILPYNKNNNKLNINKTIEYLGYSKADYRKGQEEYEIVHSFLIDLKYVVLSWNKSSNLDIINSLINEIEHIQKTIIKAEKDKAYADNIVKISSRQVFEGGVLSSFNATINNKKLKESLDNNQILYVDGFFVINDKKYVELDGNKKHLTQYALRNMNECCLAFDNTENSNDNLPFSFCETCEARRKNTTKSIRMSDKHNKKIYLRAQEADLDRVVEDITYALELKSKLNGNFAYNLKVLMDDSGYNTPHSLYKQSTIDNHKITDFLNEKKRPKLEECVALCAVFDLHPIVSNHFLSSASYNLKSENSLQVQFYDFLINYCYGESLHEWNLKISAINQLEWQIP